MFKHDPMCAMEQHFDSHFDPPYHCDDECDLIECNCEFIAEVRENTISKCVEVVRRENEKCARLPWEIESMVEELLALQENS